MAAGLTIAGTPRLVSLRVLMADSPIRRAKKYFGVASQGVKTAFLRPSGSKLPVPLTSRGPTSTSEAANPTFPVSARFDHLIIFYYTYIYIYIYQCVFKAGRGVPAGGYAHGRAGRLAHGGDPPSLRRDPERSFYR